MEIFRKHRLCGIPIKKEYGGRGAYPICSTLASERLSQAGLGANSAVGVSSGLSGTCLQVWGTDEQKEQYLKPVAKGKILLAYALTEPEGGSDPESLKASFEGRDGHYVLNGTKYLVTNGSVADAAIIFAYPKGKNQEMTAFVGDTDSDGFEVAMKLKERLGFFTSDPAMFELHDVKVPKDSVLGVAGRGLWVAYTALISGRLGAAIDCVGVIEDCRNAVTKRAKTR